MHYIVYSVNMPWAKIGAILVHKFIILFGDLFSSVNSIYLKDEKYIDNILKIGSIEAEKIARKKVNDIKQKIGF